MEKSCAAPKTFDTVAFIAAVRDREALYNTKHEHHTRKDVRVKLWDEIGQIMFPNWSSLDAREKNEKVDFFRSKWKNLKDTYIKYGKGNRYNCTKSGYSGKVWVWAKYMEPFAPFLNTLKPEENGRPPDVSTARETYKEDTEATRRSETSRSSIPKSSDVTTPTDTREASERKKVKIMRPVEKTVNLTDGQTESGFDAVDCLMLAHAKTIKTFSLRRQIITKMKIAKLIMEQELLEEEEISVWLQRKWKSLKDCFNREIRLQKHSDPKKYRKKYELYDKLTFLLVNTSEPKPLKATTPKPEVKKPQYEPESRQIRVVPQAKRIKLDDPPQKSEEDGDRLFLLSFVSDMKRLPLPTKYWVKMKFSEIMQQAAMSLNEYQDSYTGDIFEFERASPVPSDASQTDVKIPSPSSSSDIYIHQDN